MDISVAEWLVLTVCQVIVSSIVFWMGFVCGYGHASEKMQHELGVVLKRGSND